MQAPGHEEIEKNLAIFLKELFKNTTNQNVQYKFLYERVFGKNARVPFDRAFYLGNWLTDNSQIFEPDFYFDTQYSTRARKPSL
jgi:hypothetical protein